MRALPTAVFGFVMLILGACAARPTIDDSKLFWDNIRAVKVGMTAAELSEMMGPPASLIIIRDVERRTYRYTAMNGQSNWVVIPMRDGKVLAVPTTTPEGTTR